jgi:hypothetical protein
MLILGITSFFYYGCGNSGGEQSEYKFQLKEDEHISFLIDSLTSNITSAVGYFSEEGQEVIYFYNRPSHTILYFDLAKKVLVHQIPLTEQGPNTVHHPVDFQRISEDSMLIMPAYTKRMYLVNRKGEVLKRYDFTKNLPPGTPWKSEPIFFFDRYKTKCLIHTFPLGAHRQPNDFYAIPVGAVFDYQVEQTKPNLFAYPEVYQKGNVWGSYQAIYRQTIDEEGQAILSFPMDGKVYVKSLDGASLGEHEATCDAFTKSPTPIKASGDDEEYNIQTDAYEDIVYDSYRKVYYRFATKGRAELPEKRVVSGAIYKPAYVIILDKNFNKIGETRLPENRHNVQSFFVGKKGLYISDSHPDNPTNREDRLTFTCYELVPAP